MQALEFEGFGVGTHVQHGSHRMRVVGGELRIDPVGHAQQAPCVGDIGHVGRGLLTVDGETVQPFDLCLLDLGVPIGALDQTHHDPAVVCLCHIVERVDHPARAGAIGLHHNAQTVPAFQRRFGQHAVDQFQRQRQPVGFFRVDVQPHARRFRQQCKTAQARQQVVYHRLFLCDLIAWMQRAKLD